MSPAFPPKLPVLSETLISLPFRRYLKFKSTCHPLAGRGPTCLHRGPNGPARKSDDSLLENFRPNDTLIREGELCFATPRKNPLVLSPMSAVAHHLQEREQCTQKMACKCTAAIFGNSYRRIPGDPAENCVCKHPWWMHVADPPSAAGRGGCLSSGCGGYHPKVTPLLARHVYRLLIRIRNEDLTPDHASVVNLTTSTSSLSQLYPNPTLMRHWLLWPVTPLHSRLRTSPVDLHSVGTLPHRSSARQTGFE